MFTAAQLNLKSEVSDVTDKTCLAGNNLNSDTSPSILFGAKSWGNSISKTKINFVEQAHKKDRHEAFKKSRVKKSKVFNSPPPSRATFT